MAANYIYLNKRPKGKGSALTFTNMQLLVDFDPDLKYETLVYHLIRLKKTWWEDEERSIMIIKSIDIHKGRQRVQMPPTADERRFK